MPWLSEFALEKPAHALPRRGRAEVGRSWLLRSAGRAEEVVPFCECLDVRVLRSTRREDEELVSLEFLETVAKHRTVDLVEYVLAHFDDQIWTDSNDVAVEGSVVQLAQCQPIRDHRFAPHMGVRENVGGIEQLHVVEPAHGARLPIGTEHALTEGELMDSVTRQPREVAPPGIVDHVDRQIRPERLGIVHRDRERERRRVITDDEHRPLGSVPSGYCPVQVHQWYLTLHGPSKTHVVAVSDIRPAVAITKEPIRTHLVLVRSLSSLDDGDGGDAQRDFGNNGRLEDARRPHERDSLSLPHEPLAEQRQRKDLTTEIRLSVQPSEGR